MSFKPTLLPGRYLVQDLSATRSFITTDETFNTDKSKRYEPVVVLPPGVLASIWEIEINNYPDNVKKGAYLIKVHGMPVIKSEGGKVVAYGGGRLDSQWNIDAHRIGTGEFCWSISRPQGPGHDEALYWSVSFSPLDHDEHGHKRVTLKDASRPTMTQLFSFTPLEKETEITISTGLNGSAEES